MTEDMRDSVSLENVPDKIFSLILSYIPRVKSKGCSLSDLFKLDGVNRRFMQATQSLWIEAFANLDFNLNGGRDSFILNNNMISKKHLKNIVLAIVKCVQIVRSLKINTGDVQGEKLIKMQQFMDALLLCRTSFAFLTNLYIKGTDDRSLSYVIAGLMALNPSSITNLEIDISDLTSNSNGLATIGPFIRYCLVFGNITLLKVISPCDVDYYDLLMDDMMDVLTVKQNQPLHVRLALCPLVINDMEQMLPIIRQFFNKSKQSQAVGNHVNRSIVVDHVAARLLVVANCVDFRRRLAVFCKNEGVALDVRKGSKMLLSKNGDVFVIKGISVSYNLFR